LARCNFGRRARQARRGAARRLIANGIDPAEKAKQDKVAASVVAANTFEAVANELLAKSEREGLSAITLKKNRWLIGFITPVLGRRPIAEITAHELLSVLRSVETRGRHETAKRMRAICSQVFRYAIATARAERDVAADLKGALTVPKVTHRAAITTPTGAGSLLRAI
jgi:integrase